jgi:hypothetical protein
MGRAIGRARRGREQVIRASAKQRYGSGHRGAIAGARCRALQLGAQGIGIEPRQWLAIDGQQFIAHAQALGLQPQGQRRAGLQSRGGIGRQRGIAGGRLRGVLYGGVLYGGAQQAVGLGRQAQLDQATRAEQTHTTGGHLLQLPARGNLFALGIGILLAGLVAQDGTGLRAAQTDPVQGPCAGAGGAVVAGLAVEQVLLRPRQRIAAGRCRHSPGERRGARCAQAQQQCQQGQCHGQHPQAFGKQAVDHNDHSGRQHDHAGQLRVGTWRSCDGTMTL